MPWQQIRFATQVGKDKIPSVTAEDLVNLYVDRAPAGSKSEFVLRSTPGLKLWTTAGSGPCRGMRHLKNSLFVVSGSELYSIDWQGTTSLIGPIDGIGPVRMTDNGMHIAIATRDKLYAANESGIFGLDIHGMNGATSQDGYGIFTKRGTQEYYITSTDNMLSIDPLDFNTKDRSPDNLVGCISDHGELWLFGEETTEIHQNTGAAAFPFARYQAIEKGCRTAGSLDKKNNAVFWLGNNNRVYMATGYQPQRISTPQIEQLISDTSDPSTCEAFTYQQSGKTFYTMCFADTTLVYDIDLGAWHRRKGRNLDRWRGQHYADFNDLQLVGDYSSGAIYELSDTTYDDNGVVIERIAVAPPVSANGARIFFHELRVDMDVGVSLDGNAQGSDATITLDWSDDGGRTYKNELTRSIGKIGEYGHQVSWNRLGMSRNGRTFRLKVTDPVPVTIFSVYALMEVVP